MWEAIQDEARKQGMPTAGHVTNEVGLDRAMAAKQQIEHLDGVFMQLLAPGSPESAMNFAQIPPPPVILAAARATDAQLAALARKVAAAGSYHVPTLALFERLADMAIPVEQLMQGPDMRFMPKAALDQWAAQRAGLQKAGFTAEQGLPFRNIRRRIVRAFHAAGVPLMAGSDTAQSFHIWAPGLIMEVEALHAAGLSRMEALRSATIVPRNYFRSLPNGGSSLGRRADFGTVEKGARADLILLKADPSQDLAALRSLQAVITGGKVHERAALDALLDKAAADANPPQAPGGAAATPTGR